jgi:rhomboid protease GluP
MVCYSPVTYHHSHSAFTASAAIVRRRHFHPVLDLNHILLFVACISPLVLLAQTWRRGGLYRGWRLAAFAVLLVNAVAWLVKPDTAGFVGGGAWVALLVVPAIGLRKAAELASRQRYGPAAWLSRSLRLFHPSNTLRAQAEMLRALTLAQRGEISSALALLAPLRNNRTNAGRQAIAQSFRLRGEWTNLVGWVRGELPPEVRQNDFGLVLLYLRALGETGEPDALLLEFAALFATANPAPAPAWSYHAGLLMVFAFCGRLPALANQRSHAKLSGDLREFWTGTGELAAGEIPAGRTRLEKLGTTTTDRLLQTEISQRLDRAGVIAPAPLSPQNRELVRRIEQSDRPSASAFGSESARPTFAVLFFIAVNIAMFIAELAMGGSTNFRTLHRLGALEPWSVRVADEYWRLLTSLFLHYGPLHLIFNLYALFIIGPGLERTIGSVRFAIYYLLAGLGSSAGVLLLNFFGWTRSEQLVGASGCVMGVVGVWAGFLLRHRNDPMASRRLKNILLIVAVQTAFDLATPQISMAAHLSGLATGVVLGLLVRPPAKL